MKRLKQYVLFPKTNCGCGLVTLALAWPAHGADSVLIGQSPGWPRGNVYAVAVSGNYAYIAAYEAGLQVIDVSNPANPQGVGGYSLLSDGLVTLLASFMARQPEFPIEIKAGSTVIRT